MQLQVKWAKWLKFYNLIDQTDWKTSSNSQETWTQTQILLIFKRKRIFHSVCVCMCMYLMCIVYLYKCYSISYFRYYIFFFFILFAFALVFTSYCCRIIVFLFFFSWAENSFSSLLCCKHQSEKSSTLFTIYSNWLYILVTITYTLYNKNINFSIN